MYKIILDGMGGDHAPQAVVEGMAAAMRSYSDLEFVLTGNRSQLERALDEADVDTSRVKLVATSQVVLMSDPPVRTIREKPDSSLVKALNLLADDQHAMLISAGNTGALVAGATVIVQRISGVKRPALAPVLPTKTGAAVLIDGGANAECKAAYLAQFGVMGSIYMNKVLGIEEPRVALVNNGGEDGKGTPLTKEAFKLLKKAPIRFVGNAEGRDLLSGQYDVLVTDGFTGNIVLKFVEGCTRTILGMLKEYVRRSAPAKLGAALMRGVFGKLKRKMDYREYGGALLLGVNGGVMKAHGSSDAKAFFAAIRAARTFLQANVVETIKEGIAALDDDIGKSKGPEAPQAQVPRAENRVRKAAAEPGAQTGLPISRPDMPQEAKRDADDG